MRKTRGKVRIFLAGAYEAEIGGWWHMELMSGR